MNNGAWVEREGWRGLFSLGGDRPAVLAMEVVDASGTHAGWDAGLGGGVVSGAMGYSTEVEEGRNGVWGLEKRRSRDRAGGVYVEASYPQMSPCVLIRDDHSVRV